LSAAHNRSHRLHAGGAGGADGVVDQRLEFVVAELCRQELLDRDDLGGFLCCKLLAAGVFVLASANRGAA
jgi:hypothetical protein